MFGCGSLVGGSRPTHPHIFSRPLSLGVDFTKEREFGVQKVPRKVENEDFCIFSRNKQKPHSDENKPPEAMPDGPSLWFLGRTPSVVIVVVGK